MAQIIGYMLANADLALGHAAEARGAARGLAVSALASVEPDNDWPARLALQEAQIAYAEDASDVHRRQLDTALAAISASHDDDRQELRDQAAALLAHGRAARGHRKEPGDAGHG